MYKETAKLILYRSFGDHSILSELSKIFHDFDAKTAEDAELIERIYTQIKALLDLATSYGFDENLWHNYLTFLLLMNENSFSLVSEKSPVQDGSVHHFAKNDFRVVKRLFDFDFHPIEKALGIDCFSTISNYKAVAKKERMYNRNVSAMVQRISRSIETAADEEEIFQIITTFYQEYGVGMFGLNKAFRIRSCENGDVEFLPINNMDSVVLDDLIGYQMQKDMLRENTQAFVEGRNANNALLYGDSGTGKSTSIKAIVNEYYKDGLRMIEIYKHQFKDLSTIISHIKNRNYRFIIYMDDLSFEEFEIEYKFLKAVIEGGVETKPDNVVIYATSNRRHLIRETWSDRKQAPDDVHGGDSMQEKLSLATRFGESIYYGKPNQKEYLEIARELAKRYDIQMSEELIEQEAVKWELGHGGRSGRTAQQFINHLIGIAK